MMEPGKKATSPLLYHPDFMVGLVEGCHLTWYPSLEVSSSFPDHAYSTARNYSCI
jgi:hypothetical protein